MTSELFEVLGLAAADTSHPGIAVAVARAGGIGVLDLGFCRDAEAAERNFLRLAAATPASIGLRVNAASMVLAQRLLERAGERALNLILAGAPQTQAQIYAGLAPRPQHRILAEITDAQSASALDFPHHGLIAKGHEAGGWVGADTSYILVQKLLGGATKPEQPVYVQGGIGVHSAAACRALGAAGVVLEDQFLLLAESPLSEALREELARLNGAETRLYGELADAPCRVYARPASAALKAADEDHRQLEAGDIGLETWRERLNARIGWSANTLLPLGQGIGVAASYRGQYRTVGRLVQALRRSSLGHIESAAASGFLGEGGPLAASHGTRYPLAQGPMTRVSDSPEFAFEVARHGALPFLALALMRGPQVLEMLQATKKLMSQGGKALSWGVGMLGFIPQSLRDEQCEAIWQCPPPFALIAGGRPDQAAEFEKRGIATYIHAPAPALLKIYLEQGARRFVFEGRECGGHIGPLASFALWEQMVEVLLAEVPAAKAGEYHLLFAGGVHDAASAAMLAALTAPLAERGLKVGALMGTAYLFTHEIVSSGAVVEGFREQALACRRTVNLESGPGHSTRCADTQFGRDFYQARRKWLREGRSVDELRDALEDLNLGRLRVASKGLDRDAAGRIVKVAPEAQLTEGMYMIGQVATLRDQVLSIAELHRDATEGAVQRLRAQLGARAPAEAPAQAAADIAIIGLGTLLPKADQAEKYWENILDQVCVIGEVPKSRWDWELYFDADRNARDKIYSRWGGFLDEVAFDPIAYGIPPKSMKSIDPMQLLTLEVARRALADAGLADGGFDRENTSIIIGAGGGLGDLGTQYAVRAELPRFVENLDANAWDRLPEWTEESFAGSLLNVAAGRVANRLDFGGVNFTIDAACASSLAAVAMAANELESGRSNLVIAGGVDTVQSAFGFMSFSKTQALSPTGQPKAFDQSADGIAISEGLAVVVLKRLADAERDGDRIYAVIKAVAGSSDGKALGMTAPRPEGQKRALKRAYARAGFSPKTLGLIEAHGTGTPVGDRAEAQTITETLAAAGAPAKSCAIGSVKNLLGHTKASAGVCGLIKTALALHHRTLPGHYGVSKPIDTVAAENSPVYLLKDARPWLSEPAHPRRAGVSAFGFGGTNFHAVLEEYRGGIETGAASGAPRWPWELFLFRARDEAALLTSTARLTSALRQGKNLRLRDLAYSLARQADAASAAGCCLAIVARDFDGLVADLDAVAAHLERKSDKPLPLSVRLGRGLKTEAPKLALLFPGQGSQYLNMGREAALYIDELRASLESVDTTLRANFPDGLSRLILPPAAFDPETERKQTSALTDTQVAQPAIGALALGYLDFARRLGLEGAAAAGHSYGEYVALCAAGVLAPEDFLWLSTIRGRSMAEAARSSEPGAMAAVQARREKVAAAIAGLAGVRIANHNAPEQAVISGPVAGVEQAMKKLEADGARVTRLPVSGAFHTELIASAQLGLSAAIHATPMNLPRLAVYSNTTGAPYPNDAEGIRARLDGHLLNSVEFVAEIEAMYAAGCRVFLELGPKATCANMAKAVLAGRDAVAVSLDGQGGGLRGLLLGLAELAAAGVAFQAARLFDRREAKTLDLNRLAELAKPAPLPKHAWWVGGGCARPLEDPAFRTGKLLALDSRTAAEARQKAVQVPAPVLQVSGLPSPAMPLAASALPIAPALSADAFTAYQQTMRQFLNLQERVIQQFLGGGAAATPLAVPAMPALAPIAAPLPVPMQIPAAAVASVAAAAKAPAAPPAAAAFDAQAVLLEIVAERTGYPLEMLGLDQDLEAELGIDSIKRVEILGAFRKRLPGAAAAKMQTGMERYTRAKTLAAVLTQAAQDLEGAGAAASPASTPVPTAATAAPERAALQAQLLAIVAERTGYPPEMLGADQDLEAELGIDSIKRVEILGALRKQLPASLATAMQADMERFTKARSLNAILEAAMSLAPQAQPSPAIMVAAAMPAAPALEREALMQQLLALVAERTGYPVEMLGMDQDLEAELGIDSIKRVEILGALRKTLPPELASTMQAGMERFTRARSLTAIVDAAMALTTTLAPASQSAPAAEPVVAAKAAPEAERIPRYVPRSRAVALPAQQHAIDGLYLLTADAEGVAERLADRIVGAGGQAQVIAGELLSDRAALAAAFARQRGQRVVRGIVHLAGLESGAAPDIEAWKHQNLRQAKSLFTLVQLCADNFAKSEAVVLAASRFGGSLGREGPSTIQGASAAAAGAALGFFNCAAAEWPQLRARLVDFEPEINADAVADALFDELSAAETRREIGYRRKAGSEALERLGFVHSAETLDTGRTELKPESGWTVLVTGGARGITAEVAEELAAKAGRGLRLVLVGRTPVPGAEDPALAALDEPALKRALLNAALTAGHKPTPSAIDRECKKLLADREIRANLARLEAAGAQLDYRSCDVRDAEAFGALVDALYAQYGRLDAVIHGAGVIEDRRIADKTAESFDRVFDTKVDSAFVLARKLRPETLKLLVFFTSVAGRFGNIGQGDYGAANETLNRFAWQLHRDWPQTRVVSINWGPWAAGMATEAIRAGFKKLGLEPIPIAAGRRFFVEEVLHGARGDVELVAGVGPWHDASAVVAPAHEHVVLPLIRRSPRVGVGGAMTLEHRLNVEDDPYLLDHLVDGAPVLPAAAAAEYMAQFVAAGWPDWQVAELREVQVLNGVTLSDDGGREVILRARASSHSEPGQQAVTVEIADPRARLSCYRATALLMPKLADAPALAASALAGAAAFDVGRAYADVLRGARFQLLTGIPGICESGIDAEAATSSPRAFIGEQANGSRWLFDPGLIDIAPQLASLWALVYRKHAAQARRFGRIVRYGSEPLKAPLKLSFRLKPSADGGLAYDAFYADRKGEVRLAIFDGESVASEMLSQVSTS